MTISELKQQYVFQTLGIAAYVTEHASELKGAKGDGGGEKRVIKATPEPEETTTEGE